MQSEFIQNTQSIQIPALIVVGCVISVLGFVLTLLIGIVGYFIKQIHNEYKEDKKTYITDKKSFDTKIESVAEIFASKLEKIADKIGLQINEIKTTVSDLSASVSKLNVTMLQVEKDAANRYIDIHKRLDEHHDAIELVRLRVHDHGNDIAKSVLNIELEKRRGIKLEKIAEELVKESKINIPLKEIISDEKKE